MTAGDGLDREAVRRRAALPVHPCDGWQRRYAADVPALLAALRAAEARLAAVETAAWAAVQAQAPMPGGDHDPGRIYDALLDLEGVLRTEGGAS